MSKFLKISAIVILSLIVIFGALFLSYLIATRDAKLDRSKLLAPSQNIAVYDQSGNKIVSASYTKNRKNADINYLNKDTLNAFIASEDRTFYRHGGLNYRRMVKALFTNIKAGAFKEGASTISQQLIKNTHLTGDKTISRKLKEIRLTKELEKHFGKNEILEMYLNTIYFGHNCYGIESASEFYFSKTAEELTLNESATLAGLLSSPNNYSPLKNPDKSLERRNIVLKAMETCGFITEERRKAESQAPIEIAERSPKGGSSDYLEGVFDELEELNTDFYGLADGCKIYTFMDSDIQNFISEIQTDCDGAIVVTENSGGVTAFKSSIGFAKRQPGSTIKPLLVYAPSFEEGILTPYTRILDEKIDFGGYSPENNDKTYHGYVTAEESLQKSYNVPAVKTLNSLTIEKAEKYANAMNLELDGEEKNLALALGGMKYGLSLKELTDRYTIFANSGLYSPSRFIKKIVSKDGKIIYNAEKTPQRVFSEGVCSLMNGVLEGTSKTGTAKRLKDIKYDVASKTGTCGAEDGNTDAYAMCYTSEHTIGVWLGDKNNKKLKITGGGSCCPIAEKILGKLYKDRTPAQLNTTAGTCQIDIDAEEYYRNNKIVLAESISPKLNVLTVRGLSSNIPKETSTRFSKPVISAPQISVEKNGVKIQLCQTKYYSYLINRITNGENVEIYNGKWKEEILDKPDAGVHLYTVTPCYEYENVIYKGEPVTLPQINTGENQSPQIRIPGIVERDWFNM